MTLAQIFNLDRPKKDVKPKEQTRDEKIISDRLLNPDVNRYYIDKIRKMMLDAEAGQ